MYSADPTPNEARSCPGVGTALHDPFLFLARLHAKMGHHETPQPPFRVRVETIVILSWLMLSGVVYEIAARLCGRGRGPITFALLWQHYVYGRFAACWQHVVTSSAGAHLDVDGARALVNLGSYNYLGRERVGAGAHGDDMRRRANALCTTSNDDARTDALSARDDLERAIARFVGTESACVFASGFSANAMSFPALVPSNALVFVDELSHASLLAGRRIAGAEVRRYAHNDMSDLERLLLDAHLAENGRVAEACERGAPTAPRRPVWVVTEGVFSMEGTVAPLPRLRELRALFGFSLWLDEAHSIGALGATGRGALEEYGLAPDPRDVHVGTFSKAFAACGGYVAGARLLVERVRTQCATRPLMNTLCAAHIADGLRVLDGVGSAALLARLRENAIELRSRLRKAGFRVLGGAAVPVVPLLVYHPLRLVALQRELAERGVAAVVIGWPATPVFSCRARLCVSAAHSRADIALAASAIIDVGRALGLDYDAAHRR